MKPSIIPDDTVFWYLNRKDIIPLHQSIETDVVVVGGGMAGLSAAQRFAEKGLRVVLLEKNFCGSGASGKSSGFITPNSELSLSDLTSFYGKEEARRLWDFVSGGVELIKKNIHDFKIDCDYQEMDTLVLANSARAFKKLILPEHTVRQELGYESSLYSTTAETHAIINSDDYTGGLSYPDSFGIHVYRYCTAMKQILMQQGVQIFEDTPVLEIKDHLVVTPSAYIKAQHVVVCVDRFLPDISSLKTQVYHAQTCLMFSSQLTDEQVAQIFPDKRYMIWDTDMIYNYFRLTGDNRLMLGGADVFSTYASQENHHNTRVIHKLQNYWQKNFPHVPVTFEYAWPGLIGISKDLMPVAGHDQTMSSVYYVSAATGLPWAAALGRYSAESILENNHAFDTYFSPYRNFTLGPVTQAILGTKITFALSNFMRSGSF